MLPTSVACFTIEIGRSAPLFDRDEPLLSDLTKLKEKIESIRERVEASDYGIENSMAEYALVKVGMD